MKVTVSFDSDGSQQDLDRILAWLGRLSPEPMTPKQHIVSDQLNVYFHEESTTGNNTMLMSPTTTDSTTVIAEPRKKSKLQKHVGKRKENPDPFELVKQGWIVRGPYLNDKGKTSEHRRIYVLNPANQREYFSFRIGDGRNAGTRKGLTEDQASELQKLAQPNQANMLRPSKILYLTKEEFEESCKPKPISDLLKKPQKVDRSQNRICHSCDCSGKGMGTCQMDGGWHCSDCCAKHHNGCVLVVG